MSGPPHPRRRPPGEAAWTCRDPGPSRPAGPRRKLPTCIALAAALALPSASATAGTAPTTAPAATVPTPTSRTPAEPTASPPATAPAPAPAPAPAQVSTPTAPAPPSANPPTPAATPLAAPAATPGEIPPQPPRDPNDAPFMRPPNNQPRPMGLRTSPDLRRGYSSIRRVALSIVPVFASFRLPFLCRPTDNCTPGAGATPTRQHGAGVGGELDIQVIRWLWLRAQASYSLHPIQDVRVTDDKGNVSVVAPAARSAPSASASAPVVALDLGRFIPLIEGGIGALRVATPPGLRDGQMGQACLEVASATSASPAAAPTPAARASSPTSTSAAPSTCWSAATSASASRSLPRPHHRAGKFPVYLIGGLRFGVRF